MLYGICKPVGWRNQQYSSECWALHDKRTSDPFCTTVRASVPTSGSESCDGVSDGDFARHLSSHLPAYLYVFYNNDKTYIRGSKSKGTIWIKTHMSWFCACDSEFNQITSHACPYKYLYKHIHTVLL